MSCADNINDQFTPVNNATYVQMIETMVDTMNTGANIALIAFLTSFCLLSFVLISQFIIGIRNLSHLNFAALTSVAKVPKAVIKSLKDKADDAFLTFHAELDPDNASVVSTVRMDSDSDEVRCRMDADFAGIVCGLLPSRLESAWCTAKMHGVEIRFCTCRDMRAMNTGSLPSAPRAPC